jgi:hypothetical protein
MFYKSELKHRLDKIEKSLDEINSTTFLKNEFDKLTNLYNEIKYESISNQKKINESISNQKKINDSNKELFISKIESISKKLDTLYFDNETIKHQLFLENELKKSIQDIDNLSIAIHNTIELINYTIYKIDKIDKIDKV